DFYDVNIVVNEDNSFDITETINAYFNYPKHGIYRTIPLQNSVNRLDGTISNNRAIISGIEVNHNFSSYIENNSKVIKIGDADRTLTGSQNYTINYVYDIGKDTSKNYDEFYFNIIGSEWDTVIGGISFRIVMPKAFDASMLGFSRGFLDSTENTGIEYQIDGNIISGIYTGVLNPGEALTVRVQLPEGYFVYSGFKLDVLSIIIFTLPLLFVIISMILWLRFGKDERVIETVEFYPPEGFNSAEIGFLYKGKAENNDAISLLIYLANKGYLKISETEGQALFVKTKSFKLIKLKDYDGNNDNERLFLKDLFKTVRKPSRAEVVKLFKSLFNNKIDKESIMSESYDNRNEVTADDLSNSFYLTLNKIVASLNRKENKQKIFEANSLGKQSIAVIMIISIYLLITLRPIIEYGDISMLPFALIFPGIGFTVLSAMVFGKAHLFLKLFGFVWGMGFGGIPWAIMVLPTLLINPIYLVAYISGLICILIIVMLFKIMPKRSVYGNELLGKIRGFKTFLETAEKSKLEALVFQDPSYFYNILPYTYVLGVSDKWIEKFEVIAQSAPDWYEGSTTFSMASFGSFMTSTMKTATQSMSSSSGSGTSGGGSSGGGSGGGGGGSW
ncbi:MAG: DUF2207 domain-containing protein, partial [Erysipelotrichaceae bacterium]|nr:DUF2207 domain-containing protein [Erysipelotrichaceae bacterium]